MAAGRLKFQVVRALQRNLVNRVTVRKSDQQLIETIGRRSARPHTVPVGGRREGRTFWLVAEHGERADYVKNLLADPRVCVRDRGRWLSGRAQVMRDDDPRALLRSLPGGNSRIVKAVGTDLLTIRIDLDVGTRGVYVSE